MRPRPHRRAPRLLRRTRPQLIPGTDADAINQNIDAAASASGDGRCGRADAAVQRAQTHVQQLPSSVDPKLKADLEQGLARLRATAASECADNQQTDDHGDHRKHRVDGVDREHGVHGVDREHRVHGVDRDPEHRDPDTDTSGTDTTGGNGNGNNGTDGNGGGTDNGQGQGGGNGGTSAP